jgi:drug/metabolite transporter (DMT)-like permease
MAVLLGLLVAVSYGSADFLGGFASKSSPVGATVLGSQAVGLVIAFGYLLAFGGGAVTSADIGLSALAGVAGVAGVTCLFRGLAIGRMSVVAPVSAVGSALLEVLWGLARGERPAAVALVGVALALIAIAVVAGSATEHPMGTVSARAELALGVGAAIGFGGVLICLSETSTGSGMWPIVIGRLVPLPLLALMLVAARRPLLVRRADRGLMAGAGTLDATANVLLLLAVRHDLLSLVAPVTALYPAATVLLAKLVVHEQIGRARVAGLVVAIGGLALIAVR